MTGYVIFFSLLSTPNFPNSLLPQPKHRPSCEVIKTWFFDAAICLTIMFSDILFDCMLSGIKQGSLIW